MGFGTGDSIFLYYCVLCYCSFGVAPIIIKIKYLYQEKNHCVCIHNVGDGSAHASVPLAIRGQSVESSLLSIFK